MSRLYHLQPWDMVRLTSRELEALNDDLKALQRQAEGR